MINKKRLQELKLHSTPRGQIVFANLFLTPNFRWPSRKTEIRIENQEHLPPHGGAIYAMNHTDRYNYWPFQYYLYKNGYGFTSTWVKGKYYQNPAVAWFLDQCNNIPVPSMGYLITKEWLEKTQKKPTAIQYEMTKKWLASPEHPRPQELTPSTRDHLLETFDSLMDRVTHLSQWTLQNQLSLLIFPQGTRSVRLIPGHGGLAQIAMHTRAPIIPVGCNGSDRCYPGNPPWSKGGVITYRIGKPLTWDGELSTFVAQKSFKPFRQHDPEDNNKIAGLTTLVMNRINDLLDPEYQWGEPETPQKGADRFL
jgi:hypothetical protein